MAKRIIVTVDLEHDPPLDYVKERMAEAFQGWRVLQLQVHEAIVSPTAGKEGDSNT